MKSTILAAGLLLCGAMSVGAQDAKPTAAVEERVAVLEKAVAETNNTIAANEALRRTRERELTRRIDDLDAVYQRTLIRVAQICDEKADQVGVTLPQDLVTLVDGLKDHKAEGRFGRRKQLQTLTTRGRDAIGAVPVLIDVLQLDEDRYCRQYAADALGGVCSGANGILARKALAALNQAKDKDQDTEVRQKCVAAIREIMK